MDNPLIILAGGLSSRMKTSGSSLLEKSRDAEATYKAKGLLKINNRPFLDYLLEHAIAAGFTEIVFLISQFSEEIKHVYQNRFKSLKISYATQYILDGYTKPAGTADALLQVLDQFPDLQNSQFTVCNSDNLYSVNVLTMLKKSNHTHISIAYDRDALEFDPERISKFALMNIDANFFLKQIVEKPKQNQIEQYKLTDGSVRVSMNIFKFSGASLYPFLKNCPFSERHEKELPTAIQMMIDNTDQQMNLIPVSESVPDLTQKDDILRVEKQLENSVKVRNHFAGS